MACTLATHALAPRPEKHWQPFTRQKPHEIPRCRISRKRFQAPCSAAAAAQHLTLFSPSKINIFLRVVARRPDGYHDLASLFHVVDLGDTMQFTPTDDKADKLSCNVADIPTDSSNLVVKALDLFRRKTGSTQCCQVHLEKRVPHGAGLGGGSGNAATTLWAINELSGRPAADHDLLEWSAEIGSDISVFFSHGAAYCTGRGEVVEEMDAPVPLDTPLLLVKPPAGLSTPAIFRALDLDRRSSEDPRRLLHRIAREGMRQELAVNDLEQPAFEIMPELKELKEALIESGGGQFSAVFMTGSGSTIVAAGSDEMPTMLEEPRFAELFVSPARLITRQPGKWYSPARKAAAEH